jgi:hypothetical protein
MCIVSSSSRSFGSLDRFQTGHVKCHNLRPSRYFTVVTATSPPAVHQLTRDLRGSGSFIHIQQLPLRPTVRQLAGPRHAGYFCAGDSLPPPIDDPSKARPPIFSKGKEPHPTRPAATAHIWGLDQTRPEFYPTQGRQHDEWGNSAVESWCDEALR